MIDENLLMEILNSREERARKQKELIDKYNNSLISFTLNIPGKEKNNVLYRRIHKIGMEIIKKELKEKNKEVIYKVEVNKTTGSEAYIIVDMEAMDLKQFTIEIEEVHPLGRIFDIDVFDREGNQITRSSLNASSRKCLLCNKEVRLCMREKNHTYEELILRIKELAEKYL